MTRSVLIVSLLLIVLLTSCGTETELKSIEVRQTTAETEAEIPVLEKEWTLGIEANVETGEVRLLSPVRKGLSPQLVFTDLGQGLRFAYEANTPEGTGTCTPGSPNFDSQNNKVTVQFCFLNETGSRLLNMSYKQVSPTTATQADYLGLPIGDRTLTTTGWTTGITSGTTNFDNNDTNGLANNEATVAQLFELTYPAGSSVVRFYVNIKAEIGWKQISAGSNHTCGIGTDNKAYCWGSTGSGQLGNGSTSQNQASPVAVSDGANNTSGTAGQWTSISAGDDHTCGIGTDNKAYCWGFAGNGQLGNGSTSPDQASPVAVNDGANNASGTAGQWTSISAGGIHTCGIGTDNKAYCWGSAGYGKLGNGSPFPNQKSPVAVNDGANNASGTAGQWTSISAGGFYTCGIGTDNKAYCWGSAGNGQLGNGSTSPNQASPVAVNDGANNDSGTAGEWTSISAGRYHTCGIGTDNKAYCWGSAGSGRLGNESTSPDQKSPVAVNDGANNASGTAKWTSISAGGIHTCGIGTDNKAYCWGRACDGQLGNESTSPDQRSPVAVN